MKLLAGTRRNRSMKLMAYLCRGALLGCLSMGFVAPAMLAAPPAQSATGRSHARKPAPKPEPTLEELAEYVRGKFLALTPSDGYNDNLEVEFDPETATLTVAQPDGRCENYLNALDANSMIWEIFDPGDTHDLREKLLRLTITSRSGKKARICYDKTNHPDPSATPNRVRFLFSTSKAEEIPGFQGNMSKAFKKLIALSGGIPEKELF
jgi:hypothetical protein